MVYGGEDDDTVRRRDRVSGTAGTLDKIKALLGVDGGAGYDTVFVDDSRRHHR